MRSTDYVVNLAMSIFIIVGVYQFYFWCQRNPVTEPRGLKLSIDDRIPYWPSWTWIYSFLYYPVILYINLIVDSPRHFNYIVLSYIVLLLAQMLFFVLFPVVTPDEWRSRNKKSCHSERFLAFVQKFDAPSNSFPSMHTSVAMLTAMHLYHSLGPWAFAFPALIALSCLFTKQHFIADLPAGAVLGWLTFLLFRLVY
ncbi:MAG: hypothetical protein JWQ98_159 [Chlorobi bacterium]|nr:hypothetical protein [Chlorobiota bacterium]